MSDIPNPIPSSIPVPTLAPTDSSESRFQVEQAWIRKKVHKSTHAREYNDTTFIEDDRNTWERIVSIPLYSLLCCFDRQARETYDRGWEFFERFTLPRYIVDDDGDGVEDEDNKHKAERGELEKHTRLYSYWASSMGMFKEFGVGVGLYFGNLITLSVILLVCAILNIPNMTNYAGNDWSKGQETLRSPYTFNNIVLLGSAYCDQFRYIECTNCNTGDFNGNRYIQDASTGTYYFIQNLCEMKYSYIVVDYVTIVFIFIAFLIMAHVQKKVEVAFDEAKQTASDYSLTVLDPCYDATDPDEWQRFFSKYEPNGDVVCVTVAVDNQALTSLLLDQRQLRYEIAAKLMVDEVYDEEIGFEEQYIPYFTRFMNMLGLMLPVQALHENLMDVQAKIRQEVASGSYGADRIFVTFESEEGQRNALNKLNVGLIESVTDASAKVDMDDRFRGQNILKVKESTEPSALRWFEIGIPTSQKYKERFFSWLLTSCVIVGAAYSVWAINKGGNFVWTAAFISVFNTLIPIICTYINMMESHASEGGAQESLYMKISLARWANTAIIIFIVTPFTSVLTRDLVEQVYTVLFADLVTYPLYRLVDPVSYFSRWVLAPLSSKSGSSQVSVNSNFTGAPWSVAERYTDTTKTLFLAFYYASVYPASYIFCLFALLFNFVVDKYCLIRMWSPHPMTGTKVAKVARMFFVVCALAHAVLSSYWWAGFPFDNLCVPSDTTFTTKFITTPQGNSYEVQTGTSTSGDQPGYCNQDLIRSGKFPALPSWQGQNENQNWMTTGQADMVWVMGVSSVVALAAVFLGFFGAGIFFSVRHLFFSSYKESGKDQKIPFTSCRGKISGYVPSFTLPSYDHPLLACSLDDVDTDLLLDWQCLGEEDGGMGYKAYCLCSEYDLGGLEENVRKELFSRVKCYPPTGGGD